MFPSHSLYQKRPVIFHYVSFFLCPFLLIETLSYALLWNWYSTQHCHYFLVESWKKLLVYGIMSAVNIFSLSVYILQVGLSKSVLKMPQSSLPLGAVRRSFLWRTQIEITALSSVCPSSLTLASAWKKKTTKEILMRPTKAQISLNRCAGQTRPSLTAYRVREY